MEINNKQSVVVTTKTTQSIFTISDEYRSTYEILNVTCEEGKNDNRRYSNLSESIVGTTNSTMSITILQSGDEWKMRSDTLCV